MKITLVLLIITSPLLAMDQSATEHFTPEEIRGCEDFVHSLFSDKSVKKLQRACLNPLKTKNEQQVFLMADRQSRRFLSRWPKFNLNAFEEDVETLKVPKRKNALIQKDLLTVFNNFLFFFSSQIKYNFLIKEKYSHIPYNFKLKPFNSAEQLLDNLSIKSPGKPTIEGFNSFCLLPAQRAAEFLNQAQDAFRPSKEGALDIRNIEYKKGMHSFTLPVWRVLHGLGFFKNEEQESIYLDGKPELEKIIAFATLNEENLRNYLFFANFQSFSTAEPHHHIRYNKTVRKIRKAIFTHWLSDEVHAQKFMPIHEKFAGPLYAKLDAWLFGEIKLSTLLLEQYKDKTYLAYVKHLITKHATEWKVHVEEFVISPSYELAAKDQQKNLPFYMNMKKELMKKVGIEGAAPCYSRYLFRSYGKQFSFVKARFPSIDSFLEEFLQPFDSKEWELFINGHRQKMLPMLIRVENRLKNQFPKDDVLTHLKKGYLHYKELPWAAWCFLHGRPFEIEQISWQEMSEVVLEHYSQAGRLVNFLRYFETDIKPNLREDIFAERTWLARQQIVSAHWQNGHHEEVLQAIKDELIAPALLQHLRIELPVEQKADFSPQLSNDETQLIMEDVAKDNFIELKTTEEVSFDPAVVREPESPEATKETSPKAQEIPIPIEQEQSDMAIKTPPAEPRKKEKRRRPPRSNKIKMVAVAPPVPKNLCLMGDEEIKILIPTKDIEECLKEDSLNFNKEDGYAKPLCRALSLGINPGDSDRLMHLYNKLAGTPISFFEWEQYFIEFFGYFVENEYINAFLQEHVKCKELNEHYLPLYHECQFNLQNGLKFIRHLKSIWPNGYPNECLHLQFIYQTLAQYDAAPNPNFLDNSCLKLCLEQTILMRKIEDNCPLDEENYQRFEENKELIREHFTRLQSWVTGQKCNLIKNADYCHEILPILKLHYATLLNGMNYCHQFMSGHISH